MKVNRSFWISTAFGGVVSGLIWIVWVPGKSKVKEGRQGSWVEAPGKVSRLAIPASVFDRRPQTLEEKMKIIDSLGGAGFEELEEMLERWENGRRKGVVWNFADRVVRARMTQLDPKRAWLWVEEHFDESDSEEMRTEIKAEWAFQDFEGMLSFFRSRGGGESVYDSLALDDFMACRPRDWMRIFHHQSSRFGPGTSSRNVSSLKSGGECLEALEAWRDMPSKVREEWESHIAEAGNEQLAGYYRQALDPHLNGLVQEVVRRWREVDEEGFLRSEFVGWERE